MLKLGLQNAKITALKSNPKNPRVIKNDKFNKLVQSIQEFPAMLEARPIVCRPDGVVLGGNMRLKASLEAGIQSLPVHVVDWSKDKQEEFVIKDNASFGEWDWDILANEWDAQQISDWGLSIGNWAAGHDANNLSESDLDLNEEFDPIGTSSDLFKVVFVFASKDEAETYLQGINVTPKKAGQVWQVEITPSTLYQKGDSKTQ
jgi:hypothetical protein